MATRERRLSRLRQRATNPGQAEILEALGAFRLSIRQADPPAQHLLVVRECWNRSAMASQAADRIAALAVGWRYLLEHQGHLTAAAPDFVIRGALDRCCADAEDSLRGHVVTPAPPARPPLVVP
jgi:hypothetical protein